MRKLLPLLAGLGLLLATLLVPSATSQTRPNDGFQRRDGQMHVLRNGQLRPMTRDVRLPSGAVVTKDGFVVSRTGQRTELREGQGCDLRGNVVAVLPVSGGLALAPRQADAGLRSSADSRGEYYKVNRGRGNKKWKRKKRKDWDD